MCVAGDHEGAFGWNIPRRHSGEYGGASQHAGLGRKVNLACSKLSQSEDGKPVGTSELVEGEESTNRQGEMCESCMTASAQETKTFDGFSVAPCCSHRPA